MKQARSGDHDGSSGFVSISPLWLGATGDVPCSLFHAPLMWLPTCGRARETLKLCNDTQSLLTDIEKKMVKAV